MADRFWHRTVLRPATLLVDCPIVFGDPVWRACDILGDGSLRGCIKLRRALRTRRLGVRAGEAVFHHLVGHSARPLLRLGVMSPLRVAMTGRVVRVGGLRVGIARRGRMRQGQFDRRVVRLEGEPVRQGGCGGEALSVWRLGQRRHLSRPALLRLLGVVTPRLTLRIGLVVNVMVVIGIGKLVAGYGTSDCTTRADHQIKRAGFGPCRTQNLCAECSSAQCAEIARAEMFNLRLRTGSVALIDQVGCAASRLGGVDG